MEGPPVLPTAHPVLSLRAALSRQGPPVHPRAEPKSSVMCLEGIGAKVVRLHNSTVEGVPEELCRLSNGALGAGTRPLCWASLCFCKGLGLTD